MSKEEPASDSQRSRSERETTRDDELLVTSLRPAHTPRFRVTRALLRLRIGATRRGRWALLGAANPTAQGAIS